MEKILIEVFVPVSGKTYDFFVSEEMKLYEIKAAVCKMITELSFGVFIADDNSLLCYRENGLILNINLSARELELENGSGLMLI